MQNKSIDTMMQRFNGFLRTDQERVRIDNALFCLDEHVEYDGDKATLRRERLLDHAKLTDILQSACTKEAGSIHGTAGPHGSNGYLIAISIGPPNSGREPAVNVSFRFQLPVEIIS